VSKILLVTGASRGIGAATAKLAASRGYDVAVNYVRDAKAADAVVAASRPPAGGPSRSRATWPRKPTLRACSP